MSIIREFSIYLHAGISVPPVVHVNQYDQGETWIFTLLEADGTAYVPSTGALIGVKADGRAIAGVTGTVLGDGRVSITETQQMTAAAGDAVFELTIDGGSHGSANFIVRVEKKPTDGAVLSDSDLSIIQEGLNSVTPATIREKVGDWLEDNFTTPPVDKTLTISNAAADAKVVGDNITDLKSALNHTDSGIADMHELVDEIVYESKSENRLPPFDSLNTGGYLRNGEIVAYDGLGYSDYIEIDPGKRYTISLVPQYGGASNPGYEIPVKVECYDADKTFIEDKTDATFTTPKTAKYIRFNANISAIGIAVLKSRTMLTYGSVIPSTYKEYTGDIKAIPIEIKEQLENEIASIKNITIDYDDVYTDITSASTANGRAYINPSNQIVALANDTNQRVYIFPVAAGNKYRINAFGYDRDSFECALFSKFNIVAEGVPSKADADAQRILCGGSEYPADYMYHTVFFIPTMDGFLYANSRINQSAGTAGVSGISVKTAEHVKKAVDEVYQKTGLFKNGNEYWHFSKNGGGYIIRKFLRRGPNNLFQWNQVAIGEIQNGALNVTSEYPQFGTDIVGPISVWNGDLWPGQYGAWTGGNHDVTVNGNHYATAEQLSFKCTVNDEEITEDGLYFGETKFRTTNKLYFPQSIQSANLTQATPVLIEHRDYYLGAQMHVRVRLEVLTDFRCAMYYGMQNVALGYDTVFFANNELLIDYPSLAEAKNLTEPERKIMFTKSDGLHYDAELNNVGLGTYSHNDGSTGYVVVPNPSVTRKIYYALISTSSQAKIEAGTNLMWEGTYYLYF